MCVYMCEALNEMYPKSTHLCLGLFGESKDAESQADS